MKYTYSRLFILVLIMAAFYHSGGCAGNDMQALDDYSLMNLEELKEKLSDMNDKKINTKKFKTREEVISAIHDTVKRKKDAAEFEVLVNAAVKRRDEGDADHLHSVHIQADGRNMGKVNQYLKDFRDSLPNYDDLEFTTEKFAASPTRGGSITNYVFYGVLFFALVGDQLPFPPAITGFLRRHRNLLISSVTMLSLTRMSSSVTSTFEVYIDDRLIFSGISRGYPPTGEEFRRILLQETLFRDYP